MQRAWILGMAIATALKPFQTLAAPKRGPVGKLAVILEGDTPPTEFQIFKAGWNKTENGNFLFDEKAAALVMSAYKAWGVDLAIDLEHQMLADDPSPDPTSKDARGWCNLELRDDGSLWAINVRWTADGAERLTQKRQRYVSPAFTYDTETGRIGTIMNVAITAIPATHNAQPLMAAARDLRKLSTGPSLTDVQAAICAALAEQYPSSDGMMAPWVVDVFDASAVYQNDGKYFEVPYTYDAGTVTLGAPVEVARSYTPVGAAPSTENPSPDATPAPATPPVAAAAARKKNMFPKALLLAMLAAVSSNDKEAGMSCLSQVTTLAASAAPTLPKALSSAALEAVAAGDKNAALDLLKQILASLVGGGDPDAATEDAPPPVGDAGGDENTEAAAARVALSITGKASIGEAMAELQRRSKVAVQVEEREAVLAVDRAKLELSERTEIIKSLQKIGVETPATSGLASGKLCDRLLNEPIEGLRSRHAMLLGAKGTRTAVVQPPAGEAPPLSATADGEIVMVAGVAVTLSKRELEMLSKSKSDKQKYAADKLRFETAKPKKSAL